MDKFILDYLGFRCFFMVYNKYDLIVYKENTDDYINKNKSIREMIIEIPNITPNEAYHLEKKMEYIYKEHLYVIQEE